MWKIFTKKNIIYNLQNNNELENISEQNKDELITTNYKFDTENQLYSYQIKLLYYSHLL